MDGVEPPAIHALDTAALALRRAAGGVWRLELCNPVLNDLKRDSCSRRDCVGCHVDKAFAVA